MQLVAQISQTNCIFFFYRLEMYFHYQFGEDVPSPSFPNLQWTEGTILVTEAVPFNNYLLTQTQFYLSTLQKVFYTGRDTIAGHSLPDFERYGPATKTCLVLCAERLMEIFEIPFFKGKISRQISAYKLQFTQSDIWEIPSVPGMLPTVSFFISSKIEFRSSCISCVSSSPNPARNFDSCWNRFL